MRFEGGGGQGKEGEGREEGEEEGRVGFCVLTSSRSERRDRMPCALMLYTDPAMFCELVMARGYSGELVAMGG